VSAASCQLPDGTWIMGPVQGVGAVWIGERANASTFMQFFHFPFFLSLFNENRIFLDFAGFRFYSS
jgi:hypothetical protein